MVAQSEVNGVDKQEYKILSEEIMTLIANEQFVEAVEIADRIDWRKVRSFTTLQRISDLYKINRRYDEALEILLMAYDRNPNSKTIVYNICDLYLEAGDLVSALQYMAVYNKMAPKDVGCAILKYKVLEKEDASFEDRVDQLEKIVAISYQEEWVYQLAYMYHRMGLATKCVETCNQLISWFGEGPFVIKAMELKMLHSKLSATQQEIYDHRDDIAEEIEAYESEEEYMPEVSENEEEDFHVKTIDMSKFNTINLQKALAESMRELMGDEDDSSITHSLLEPMMDEDVYTDSLPTDEGVEELVEEPAENITDISEEEEAELEESAESEKVFEEVAEEIEETAETTEDAAEENEIVTEVESAENELPMEEDLCETAYIGDIIAKEPVINKEQAEVKEEIKAKENEVTSVNKESETVDSKTAEIFFDDKTGEIIIDQVPLGMLNNLIPGVEFVPPKNIKFDKVSDTRFAGNLSQESDGQISLAVPESLSIEKQITGQMNLEEVMAEWEKIKKIKEQQQDEEVRRNILDKTGQIFEDYDKSRKDTIIAQIEKEQKNQRRVLNNEIELRKLEEIPEIGLDEVQGNNEDMSVTMELNKVYSSTIWDEVDKAIAEDSEESKKETDFAGAAIAGIGELAKDAGELAIDAVEVASEVGEGIVAAETVAEGALAAEASLVAGTVGTIETVETIETIEQAASTVSEIPENSSEVSTEIYENEEKNYEDADEQVYDEEPEEVENNNILNTEQINDIGSALEAAADEESEKTLEEIDDSYSEESNQEDEERDFSPEEKELFADFLYSKKMRAQILDSVDIINMASYVGNVIITGDAGTGMMNLAKAVIKEIQLIDSNFNVNKVAKISGQKMNQKDIPAMLSQLANGALIVEKSGKLTRDAMENLTHALENMSEGIIIILTDSKKEVDKIVKEYPVITGYFNARIDIVPMSNNALVEYAKKYAYSKEYKIDEEKAVLALHERISELQIGEHHVTTKEVEDIVDDAIEYSKKPHISTFFTILAAKRYDYEDMIILREKDFGY